MASQSGTVGTPRSSGLQQLNVHAPSFVAAAGQERGQAPHLSGATRPHGTSRERRRESRTSGESSRSRNNSRAARGSARGEESEPGGGTDLDELQPGGVDAPPSAGPSSKRAWRRGDHLVSFRYDKPENAQQHQQQAAGGGGRSTRRDRNSTHRSGRRSSAPLSREAFVQAHFRVLVLAESARRVPGHGSRSDPDAMVEWADVVSVESCAHTPPACPICLEDEPEVPQVTPCGHVFCFGCIARHLLPKDTLRGDAPSTTSSGGAQPPPALYASKGCPMCGTLVRLADLRRVTLAPATMTASAPPHDGGTASFTLLARPKDSLVPTPVAELVAAAASAGAGARPGWPYADPLTGRLSRWAKFTLTSDENAAVSADLAALEEQMEAAMRDDGPFGGVNPAEVTALSAAMDAVHARASVWAERRDELLDCSIIGGRFVSRGTVPIASSPPVGSFGSAGSGSLAASTRARISPKEGGMAARGQIVAPPGQPVFETQSWRGAADAAWADESDEEPSDGDGCELVFASDEQTADVPVVPLKQEEPDAQPQTASTQAAPAVAGLPNPADTWLFYQAVDGSCVTLHPLCVRALVAHFGSYELFPQTLANVPVIHVEHVTQSEATRQRLRHLAHWPLATPFALAEVDLSHIVSAQAWAETAQERKQRASKRAAAAAAAKREAAAAKAAEEARVAVIAIARAAAAPPRPDELSAMPRLGASDAGAGAEEAAAATLASPPPSRPAGMSFARVADMGYASGLNSPVVGRSPAATPSPVTPGSRPVWVAKAASSSQGGGSSSSPPAASLGWFGGPASSDGQQAPSSSGGGKKGKGQLLFSTTQRRY